MAIFEIHGPDRVHSISLTGRPAWLLFRLIDAGSAGLTASDLPSGLRVSGYVHRLRRSGIDVNTTYEANTNEFGGSHGRYALASIVNSIGEAAQ